MPLKLAYEDLAPSTRELKDKIDKLKLSPRFKLALRMYAFGGCRTLTEAAETMDVSLPYLSLIHASLPGQQLMESAEKLAADRLLEGTDLLNKLGRRALEVTASIMENGSKEENRLRAAIDLTDRSPDYSKVQKHQVESITLTGRDAKELAAALVNGPRVHEQFAHLASGDYNRIEDGSPSSQVQSTDSISGS